MIKNCVVSTRKSMFVIILLIFLFPLYLKTQGDALIIPGVGVGVIRLGDSFGDIRQSIEYSKANSWRKVETQEENEIWISYEELGMTLIYGYETKILEKIMVLTEALLVENTGIRVGSREAEVLQFFGDPELRDSNDELDYPNLGIKFYLENEDRTVYMIEVKRKKIPEN